jgi:hypothetical protein
MVQNGSLNEHKYMPAYFHNLGSVSERIKFGSDLTSQKCTSESESYFTTGGLQQISSSWRQAPWDSIEIHDQICYSFLDMYVFRNRASSSTKEGSVFLCRRYVCCTVVSARVYPRCHGIQVTVNSVHPLSLHYMYILSNIYTRYTEVSCQRRSVQQVMP